MSMGPGDVFPLPPDAFSVPLRAPQYTYNSLPALFFTLECLTKEGVPIVSSERVLVLYSKTH